MAYSRCDKCNAMVADIDAGFSPGLHEMGHGDCGGTWRVVPDASAAAAILGRRGGSANTPAQQAARKRATGRPKGSKNRPKPTPAGPGVA